MRVWSWQGVGRWEQATGREGRDITGVQQLEDAPLGLQVSRNPKKQRKKQKSNGTLVCTGKNCMEKVGEWDKANRDRTPKGRLQDWLLQEKGTAGQQSNGTDLLNGLNQWATFPTHE